MRIIRKVETVQYKGEYYQRITGDIRPVWTKLKNLLTKETETHYKHTTEIYGELESEYNKTNTVVF